MGIFNIFKPKKKVANLKMRVSVEEQIIVLSNLGIKPKQDGYVDWICYEWSRDAVEADPYNLMLFSLGGERESGDKWERLSDDVYSFDTECVEDDDVYADIFINLAALSKGVFSVTSVSSAVEHENHSASISFVYNNANYNWNLKYDDDWFDKDVVNRINQLVSEMNPIRSFYTCSPGQNLTTLFTSQDVIEKVNSLVTIPFILGT